MKRNLKKGEANVWLMLGLVLLFIVVETCLGFFFYYNKKSTEKLEKNRIEQEVNKLTNDEHGRACDNCNPNISTSSYGLINENDQSKLTGDKNFATEDSSKISTSKQSCGNNVSYHGKSYKTVLINNQCWFAQNLDYDNGCSLKTWNHSGDIDVGWCGYYTGGPFPNEGLLYQWSAVMNDSETPGSRGICPDGWHIPTDFDWSTLEINLTDNYQYCQYNRVGWECSGAGTKMKSGGLSGFNDLLVGAVYDPIQTFGQRGSGSWYWSSDSQNNYNAYKRGVNLSYTTILRDANPKGYGFSIRCIKD